MITQLHKKAVLLLLITSSILFTVWLGSRYFPVEPDVANSPVVWQEILNTGIGAINSWQPTVDNWYFTVYPVNFITYYILGDSGLVSLKISTVIFSISIVFLAYGIVTAFLKKRYGAVAIILLTLIPAFGYKFGFIGHPFSHNSTNCFGLLCLLIIVTSVDKISVFRTCCLAILATLSSVSDPWFLAAYFIPMVIYFCYIFLRDKYNLYNLLIVVVFFFVSWKGFIQKIIGLPVHHFSLVPLHTMLDNLKIFPLLIGKSLNLFFVDNEIAAYLSFCVWVAVFLHSIIIVIINKHERYVDFVIISLFSVLGVVSSFVLSYASASEISARFFVNVTCLALILCCLYMTSRFKIFYIIISLLFALSSINSYVNNKGALHNQYKQNIDYITFLKVHNLNYGYGAFWGMSNTVTWLSNGDINVIPVFFDKDNGTVDFHSSRVQTMKKWLDEKELRSAPNRQFVSISTGLDGERCISMEPCLLGIKKQLGEPDEILKYGSDIIFVYNKRLGL